MSEEVDKKIWGTKLPDGTYESKYDWVGIKVKWLERVQQGKTSKAMCKEFGLPYSTGALKFSSWRKELLASDPLAREKMVASGEEIGAALKVAEAQDKSTPHDIARRILLAGMPLAAQSLVAQLTDEKGRPAKDAGAARAAIQMLKELEGSKTDVVSPYASMKDDEIELRVKALWPLIGEARKLLGHGV